MVSLIVETGAAEIDFSPSVAFPQVRLFMGGGPSAGKKKDDSVIAMKVAEMRVYNHKQTRHPILLLNSKLQYAFN